MSPCIATYFNYQDISQQGTFLGLGDSHVYSNQACGSSCLAHKR